MSDTIRSRSSRRSLVAGAVARAVSTTLAGLAAGLGAIAVPTSHARAEDVSAPAILQMFEASWKTMEKRAPDIFSAGYGGMWVPPPGRADTSDQSVGYDVYDRFDLGFAGKSTLYGTETGLRTTLNELHKFNTNVYADLVWNHNGYSTSGTNGFTAAGGYPGFMLSNGADQDGDFHGAFEGGDQNMRVAGLIDIAQEKNYLKIRSPVDAGNANNLPAGTTPAFGRLANVPTAANKRFYPDQQLGGHTYSNPATGGNTTLYDFNPSDSSAGDAVTESALGYLMRNSRWMIQDVGFDGFRMDATKHMGSWVFGYYDQAVWNAIQKKNLDGSQKPVFAFGEYFDGNMGSIQSTIRKDLNQGNWDTTVRGNRDALDFPLFFAMNDNLTGNGVQNDWRNIKNASLDVNDDGLANNGSQGVAFVSSHDKPGAYLTNVAYAYVLMRPGNAIVYHNAKEFGDNRDFPADGRGDALGGYYGDKITTLVDIRNTHGRGNYKDRTPTADAKEMLIYEREKSALVVLSNRLDGGYDSRTITTSFAPGTPLLELTGNAADSTIDPFNDFPEVLTVNGDGTVNLRVPRNKAPGANGVQHNKGYFIYGPSGPQGSLSISNVSQTLAGATPSAANNGTARLADVKVVTANSFDVTLKTSKVNLLGSIRDHDADGDNALVRIDGGLDINSSGTVDFRTPGDYKYGYEQFTTLKQPGYSSANNLGTYTQSVDATQLSEGYHYVSSIAFRHRDDGGPAIFSNFKQTIYVDRLKPVSSIASFQPWDANNPKNRDAVVRSDDKTATQVQILIDEPAISTEAQILAKVGANGFNASQLDRDLFKFGFFDVNSGNHVFTIVTKEITGNYNVQRVAGQFVQTNLGAGLGDVNANGTYDAADVTNATGCMEALIYPNAQGVTNTAFNGAADMNGDGLMDSRDLYLQRDRFTQVNAPQAARDASKQAVLRRGNINGDGVTDASDIDHLYANLGNTAWKYDLDVDGWPTPTGADQQDVDTLVKTIFHTRYGDANLDGRITFDDYVKIDLGFNNQSTGWANGDFNGSGTVNFDDYVIIDINFNEQGGGAAALAQAQAWLSGDDRSMAGMDSPGMQLVIDHFGELGVPYASAFIAAVPEPTATLLLLGASALAGGSRRRTRRTK